VIVNSADFAVRAAADGLGIAYASDALVEPFLRSEQLIRVLDKWCPSMKGLFLHHPRHRQIPAALRALIDMTRAKSPTGELIHGQALGTGCMVEGRVRLFGNSHGPFQQHCLR
jgi:hypothetical protein